MCSGRKFCSDVSVLHSLSSVSMDSFVGSDGSGSRSSPLSDGNSSGDLGETVVSGGSHPLGVGSLCLFKSFSSVVSPVSLNSVGSNNPSVGNTNSMAPDFDHVDSVSIHFQSTVSLVISDISHVDGVL